MLAGGIGSFDSLVGGSSGVLGFDSLAVRPGGPLGTLHGVPLPPLLGERLAALPREPALVVLLGTCGDLPRDGGGFAAFPRAGGCVVGALRVFPRTIRGATRGVGVQKRSGAVQKRPARLSGEPPPQPKRNKKRRIGSLPAASNLIMLISGSGFLKCLKMSMVTIDWPKLVLLNSSGGVDPSRSHVHKSARLRVRLEWGALRPPNSSVVGERWSLMVSRSVNGASVAVRRILLLEADPRPFLVALPTYVDTGSELELRACRICTKCSGDESISSAWRPSAHCQLSDSSFYNSTGVCTRPHVLRVRDSMVRQRHPISRTAQASSRCGAHQLLSLRLQGSWAADGSDFVHDEACEVLPAEALLTLLRKAVGLRVLFIGDSTLEEVALIFAHASGYKFDELDVKPCGNASHYRHFDAMGGAVSMCMRWAGHPDCRYSFGAASLPFDRQWSAMIRATAVRLRPHVVVFNAAAGHHLRACEMARWGEQKAAACAHERVRPRLLAYLRFVAGVARDAGALPVFVSTAFTTDRKCNVDLASFHALCLRIIDEEASLQAARVVALHVFAPSYSWLSSVASEGAATALNGTCWTSGHCSCLGKAHAFAPHAVSPPCWLEARALGAVILDAWSAVSASTNTSAVRQPRLPASSGGGEGFAHRPSRATIGT